MAKMLALLRGYGIRLCVGFVGLPQRNQIVNIPQSLGNPGCHCGGHTDRSVNLNEVVGKVIEGSCRSMIPELARKPVGETSVAAHFSSDGPILALNVACRYVLGVWVATDVAHVDADATSRRIARLVLLWTAVNFLQYRVVNFPSEASL